MDYELAKQLKDAGFPQKGFIAHIDESGRLTHHYVSYYCPTLEELIEACGNDFKDLIKHDPFTTATLGVRLAQGDYSASMYDRNKSTFKNTMFAGKTPSEAVARLWLVLNKK